MIRVAVVEDEKEAADLLESQLARYEKESGGGSLFSVTRFDNAITFLTNYRPVYDIVFMDIEMPDLDGLAASQKLREIDRSVILIFITNLAQFAVRGYEVDALDFVVKPVTYYVLALKLKRAIERLDRTADAEIGIQSDDAVIRVRLSEIKYVEILAHKIIWHTTHGDYKSYGTLKKVEAKLENGGCFVRCNSCYLVNLAHVTGIKGYTVRVGGDELTISHARRRDFVRAVNDYMGW